MHVRDWQSSERVARDGKGMTQLVAAYNKTVAVYGVIVVSTTKVKLINEGALHAHL